MEKKIKKQIIKEASSNPEKYYPVNALKELGFKRFTCSKCGGKFWSTVDRDICGDPNCTGQYTFINNSPCKEALSFTGVWEKFREMFRKKGYEPIARFPVVARWRDDLDFNNASIVGFQPYVVNGDVNPVANPLTIPQICLRFPDIDNVGYTGRHATSFTMIGQHAFMSPDKYDQEKYFTEIFQWINEGMGIPKEEIQVIEDSWAGGGNCGPSLELFSRGLEIANQVYMLYDMTQASDVSELRELDLKVLDMGMGQERCAWICQGSPNQYEATMPQVCKFLYEKTGFKPNMDLYEKFIPYSGILNLDEADNIDEAWQEVADKINVDKDYLKSEIEPIAGIYSIADHTRTLLYALTDGALPSNVKGGYNLRLIFRRALNFIDKFNWNIDLYEVMKKHAEELKPQYPEFVEEVEGVNKIIQHEIEKYKEHSQKVKDRARKIASKGKELSTEDFIKLYISEGITPEDLKAEYRNLGKDIKVPSNFFTLVNEYFENKKKEEVKEKEELEEYVKGLPETQLVYYNESWKYEEEAELLKEFTANGRTYLVFDKTVFYPEGGGQAEDTGYVDGRKVKSVKKVNNVVLHEVE